MIIDDITPLRFTIIYAIASFFDGGGIAIILLIFRLFSLTPLTFSLRLMILILLLIHDTIIAMPLLLLLSIISLRHYAMPFHYFR